jgi:hypothetical protein
LWDVPRAGYSLANLDNIVITYIRYISVE